jgi:hypothetical protein
MLLEAVLCNDGVYRVPPMDVVDVEQWANGFLFKVIPSMYALYKIHPEIFRLPTYYTTAVS